MTLAQASAHTGRERRAIPALVTILIFLLGGLTVALLYHFDAWGSSSNAADEGSGIAATQLRRLSAFDSVELAGNNSVVIHVGARRSVVVRGDDNLLDRVTTVVRTGKLVVANTRGSFTTKSPMSVDITVPTLDALTLTGNGNMVVDGVEAKRLTVSLPGNGTLTGSGAVKRLDVTIGGSGTVQFTRLVANDVRAVVSGSGSIFVTATATLDASVSGAGSIVYVGNPQNVTRSVTGTGTIAGS